MGAENLLQKTGLGLTAERQQMIADLVRDIVRSRLENARDSVRDNYGNLTDSQVECQGESCLKTCLENSKSQHRIGEKSGEEMFHKSHPNDQVGSPHSGKKISPYLLLPLPLSGTDAQRIFDVGAKLGYSTSAKSVSEALRELMCCLMDFPVVSILEKSSILRSCINIATGSINFGNSYQMCRLASASLKLIIQKINENVLRQSDTSSCVLLLKKPKNEHI